MPCSSMWAPSSAFTVPRYGQMEPFRHWLASEHLLCAKHCAKRWGCYVDKALGDYSPGEMS